MSTYNNFKQNHIHYLIIVLILLVNCSINKYEKKTTNEELSISKEVKVKVPPFKDIFFDFDKSNIRADAEPILQENAELLNNNPDIHVVIESYADLRGSVQYNIGLAQRRADATKAYLVGFGADPSRIEAIGIGETEKFGEGTMMATAQLNRRSHFSYLPPPIPMRQYKIPNEELSEKISNILQNEPLNLDIYKNYQGYIETGYVVEDFVENDHYDLVSFKYILIIKPSYHDQNNSSDLYVEVMIGVKQGKEHPDWEDYVDYTLEEKKKIDIVNVIDTKIGGNK